MLAPGCKLGRYELLCPLAQGGMAVVWVARPTNHHGDEKLVAIKTPLPKFADDERFQRMLLDEAQIGSLIKHPNVAQILDGGEQEGIAYLVMEYLDGDTLSALRRAVKRKGMSVPPGVLLRIMVEVCSGLHAAHELRAGVVHCDVSPPNVLVTVKGVAKLIDFGIAKARDRIAGDTGTGTLKGRVRYMAPEQALGRPVDRRADLWSVGAVLYRLLSGQPPYRGDTEQVLTALRSGQPPLPLGKTVHPAVDAIVMRALAWAPEERFATAQDLQWALEDAMGQARLGTTASKVASFFAEHVGDLAQHRKETITLWRKAAADREQYSSRMRADAEVASLLFAAERMNAGSAKALARRPSTEAALPTESAVVSVAASQMAVRAPRRGRVAVASAVVLAILAITGLGLATRATLPWPTRADPESSVSFAVNPRGLAPMAQAAATSTSVEAPVAPPVATGARIAATAGTHASPVLPAAVVPVATAASTPSPTLVRAVVSSAIARPAKARIDDGF